MKITIILGLWFLWVFLVWTWVILELDLMDWID